MEAPQKTAKQPYNFSLVSVVAIAVLVGVLGFAIGSNFDRLSLQLSRFESQNDHLPEQLDYSSVDRVYDLLRQNYAGQLSLETLMDGLKKGLVEAAGDPFTEYLNAEAAAELERSLNGEFSGIGAEIGIRSGQLVIIAPLEGTPAARAGLRSGDAIMTIDGEDSSRLSINEAVARIRGEEGTGVLLTILREGQSPMEVEITRGVIEVPSVRSEMLDKETGYIELVQFGNETPSEFRRQASALIEQGMSRLVLDVRNNPGGYLDVAVAIASEFLPAGEVVVEERRGDVTIGSERASNGGILIGMPVAVLVNGGSASASEIIAGALQDYGVGIIVGEQTFGKGSVQQLLRIGNGDVLRVTIANWHTPQGHNINESGITPEVEVELTEDDVDSDRDPQLDRARELLLRR